MITKANLKRSEMYRLEGINLRLEVMTDQSRSDKTEQERFDKQAQVREIRQDSIHEIERGSAGEIRQGYVTIEGNSDRSDMSVEERTYGCIEEIRQGE